jgi:uncharacterized membrane protein
VRYSDYDIERWVSEGLIREDQAAAIRARQAAPRSSARRAHVVSVLALTGSAIAGVGVILFVGANWDGIPRALRVALLLALLVGSYGLGFVLRHSRGTHPLIGSGLLLLGGISFGASIFLVGQMYDVQAHDPLGLLLWSALVAPTAIVLRSRPLATLALLAFEGWIIFELAALDLENAAPLYFALVGLTGCAFLACGSGLAVLLERAGFGKPMRMLGYAALLVPLYSFTFPYYDASRRQSWPAVVWLLLVIAACFAVAGSAALFLLGSHAAARWQAAALAASTAFFLLVVLAPQTRLTAYLLLANFLLVVVALGAVVVGHLGRERWLVPTGLVAVTIDAMTRYFDFTWHMLPRSLVFVGAGVLLLVIAFLVSRQRRRLVAIGGAR